MYHRPSYVAIIRTLGFIHFEVSFSCTQQPANGHYLDQNKHSPYNPSLLI